MDQYFMTPNVASQRILTTNLIEADWMQSQLI